MVDAVEILPPGWRATDSNGTPITDGILAFFDAGTNNPKIVYADSGLATALGTTVTCNSAGVPVTSGNAPTLIYTGNAAYKIRLTSVILGGTVFEFDLVKGALDSSIFLTAAFIPDVDVISTSSDLPIFTTHKGQLIDANCTGATLRMTLDTAANLGAGWWGGFRHGGNANAVEIVCLDPINRNGATTTSFALTGKGQTVWLACDGTSLKVYSETAALISNTTGWINISGRLSAPPGSPAPGARYILTAAPSGAWSTFAEHDIAEYGAGGTWYKYTPPVNAGWFAYVVGDYPYWFPTAAWLPLSAGDVRAGLITTATQADMETPVSVGPLAVTPGRMQYHPGVAKFWAYVTYAAGVPTLAASYNVTSITDDGVGLLTITIATDFSSALWSSPIGGDASAASPEVWFAIVAKTAGTIQINATRYSVGLIDPDNISVSGFGDQ